MSEHRYGKEPECLDCGAFGPLDDHLPCVTPKQPWYKRLAAAVGNAIGEAKFGGE